MIDRMETFWVQIFNQRTLENFIEKDLMAVLLETNFESLCNEYGLDLARIGPALSNLELIDTSENIASFFLLRYQPHGGAPLVVYRWASDAQKGMQLMGETQKLVRHPLIKDQLAKTREIFAVSLRPNQLKDFGLLLVYEVARWAGAEGQGLVLGLDGIWYRLNQHRAFIPIALSAQN
jgi:hypothetical protein